MTAMKTSFRRDAAQKPCLRSKYNNTFGCYFAVKTKLPTDLRSVKIVKKCPIVQVLVELRVLQYAISHTERKKTINNFNLGQCLNSELTSQIGLKSEFINHLTRCTDYKYLFQSLKITFPFPYLLFRWKGIKLLLVKISAIHFQP